MPLSRILTRTAVAFACALPLASGYAMAQGTPHQHAPSPTTPTESQATKAYREANASMHKGMDIAFTGDADVDFARSMIPHHQGAIDMAKVVLQYGKDEEVRKWANDVIREQEREIAEMKAWLQKKGQP